MDSSIIPAHEVECFGTYYKEGNGTQMLRWDGVEYVSSTLTKEDLKLQILAEKSERMNGVKK